MRGVKILILKDAEAVAKKSASLIVERINKNPKLVLGLATGETMLPLYEELRRAYKRGEVNFSEVKTFNLDEYFGINSDDKNSYRSYMDKELFNKVNLRKKNINFLDGDVKEYKKVCIDYEKKIKSVGGIDLQILGIGRNGHIAFNEPGSSFKSRTRKVRLSERTRRDNSKYFFSLRRVPKFALSMGIGTIMESKEIVLLASGKRKANAIHKSIDGKITNRIPASVLRKHKKATFILDRAAASDFNKI